MYMIGPEKISLSVCKILHSVKYLNFVMSNKSYLILSTIVHNSRDRYENVWLPDFLDLSFSSKHKLKCIDTAKSSKNRTVRSVKRDFVCLPACQ